MPSPTNLVIDLSDLEIPEMRFNRDNNLITNFRKIRDISILDFKSGITIFFNPVAILLMLEAGARLRVEKNPKL